MLERVLRFIRATPLRIAPLTLLAAACAGPPEASDPDTTEETAQSMDGLALGVKPQPDVALRRELAAKKTTVLATPTSSAKTATTAYTGADFEGTSFSFGDLEPVDDAGAYPARVNVALGVFFPSGSASCSGTLIDSRHVVTAAHCIYDEVQGGWANEIVVLPGDGSYGYAYAVDAMAFSGFVSYDNWDYDLALVYIDRPVGALTGFHGYGVDTCASLSSGNYYSYSYPDPEPYNGEMYYWDGDFDWCPLAHTVQTNHNGNDAGVPGMSGGGVYNVVNAHPFVRAVWSRSYDDVAPEGTRAVRLWDKGFYAIQDEIASHRNGPADLIPVGLAFPEEVTPALDDTPSGVRIYVHNYGTQDWSGSVEVKFYLSINATITSNDLFIGSVTEDLSIDAMHTAQVLPGNAIEIPLSAVPDYVHTQFYYVGAIIEADDDDSANNTTIRPDVQAVQVHRIEAELEVSDVDAENGSYLSSEELPVAFEVTNDGGLASGAWSGSFYLSKSQNVGADAIFLGKGTAPALAPGQVYSDDVSLDLHGVATGSYYLHLLVHDDDGGEVASGFDPTKINVDFVFESFQGQPANLKINYVGFSSQVFDGSDDLSVAYSVTNSGSQNSGVWNAGIYASPVPWVSSDMVYLGGGVAPGLPPGGSTASIANLSLANLSPGLWYIVMIVAADDETTMNDNVKVSAQSFEVEMGAVWGSSLSP